jgi:hypothetical protein
MRSTTYWFYTYHAENLIHLLGRLKAEFAVEFQFTKTCLQIDLAHSRWVYSRVAGDREWYSLAMISPASTVPSGT